MADGKGCVCGACCWGLCSCPEDEVDWTPLEIYKLRTALVETQEELALANERLAAIRVLVDGMKVTLENLKEDMGCK